MDRGLPSLIRRRLWPEAGLPSGGLWLQAVSLGEVEVASTFAHEVRRMRPGLPILATATTPAGFALLKRRFGEGNLAGTSTRPFPLDLAPSVRRFFLLARPELLVLVETELWPGVLAEAGRRGVPVLLVNARLSERSAARYRALRPLFRRPLSAVSHVAARTAADAGRFVGIGIPEKNVSVAGDLKYDRTEPPAPPFAQEIRRLAGGRPVLVTGSLADEEIPLVIELRRRLVTAGSKVFVLLAPRRPESFAGVARLLEERGIAFARRSEPAGPAAADIYLLDTIGELGSAYSLGTLALLGGTFAPRGGHNVLEPLAAGLPVLLGPSTGNIASTLGACPEAIFAASGIDELEEKAIALLSDETLRRRAAEAAQALFRENRGAAGRAAAIALSLLDRR